MDPKGKVALVTGGAEGIGLAIVKELLKHGAKGVAICDREERDGKAAVKKLQEVYAKESIKFIKMDVTEEDEFKDAFEDTIKHFGSLDIVVNNAGICDDSKWQQEVDVNVNGVIRGTLLALKYMDKEKNGKGGVVINTASVAGLPMQTVLAIYCATKFAVVGFTHSMGNEFIWEKTGLRVMAICPGSTDTPLFGKSATKVINTYRKDWMTKFSEDTKHGPIQNAQEVGAAVIHMIREGKPGSVWVIDNEPVYEVKLPHYKDMRV